MIHTQYSNLRNNDLIRMVDAKQDASPLEKELAERLERLMNDKDFASLSGKLKQ